MMATQRDEYSAPSVMKGSGPPRAIYLAPVYEWRGKTRFIVGERLTSMENPLSADSRDEQRYLRKGFKLATKADIQRLGRLEGKARLFEQPLERLDQLGIVLEPDTNAKTLANKLKEVEQKLAVLEAEKAAAAEQMEEIRARNAGYLAKARAEREAKARARAAENQAKPEGV